MNGLCENDTSLGTITFNQTFYKVYYIWHLVNVFQWFSFSFYKGNPKCKPTLGYYVFIHRVKILFTPGVYMRNLGLKKNVKSFKGAAVYLWINSLILSHLRNYKNLFLRKKKNQAGYVRHLIWPERKKEKESQTIRYQKATPSFCRELLFKPSVRIRGPNCMQEKLASRWVSSLASWIELLKK